MMVLVGNPKPVELVLDSVTTEQGISATVQVLRPLGGETITRLLYPDGMGVEEAALCTIDALKFHMERGALPAWIESDSKPLHKLLCKHYGINTTAKRPGDWGMAPAGGN